MEKADIFNILRSNKTVFSFKDILLASQDKNPALLNRRLNYYVKRGELYPIRKGLYAKDKNYSKFELATKIFTPSYVSFETVLAKAGVIFQFYNQIFVASYLTREIVVDGQSYSYKKVKDSVLTNRVGVEAKGNYYIASLERAFLDIIYSRKGYHFDNLLSLDWEKVFEFLPIYKNKSMEKRVKKYHKKYKTDNFDTDYQNILFPENPNVIYIIGFDDFGNFKPIYVGESGRNIGRLGDYISAQFSAQTDFKVGIAVKYLKELDKKVIVKYRNSENKRKEQNIIIRKLQNQSIKLLNDVSGYNYRTANKEAETKKIKLFIDKIVR